MQLDRFALLVLVGGKSVREYGLDGRTYVAGTAGKNYNLRLVSRSPRRTKVVLSVDGLNVVDGKPAGLGGSGYIIEPYSALDIPGWRLNDEAVARFVFGAPESSFASSKGKAENVGVIGAAFFDEVPPAKSEPEKIVRLAAPVPTAATRGPRIAKGFAAASASTPGTLGGSLGTGFGTKADHAVRQVEFEAREQPAAVLEIRYEDAAILRGLGVEVADESDLVHSPTAFPAEGGYCSPPAGWRG